MSNYAAGRAKEYELAHMYETKGYLVVRSAASHSPVDLICFSKENIILCQVKKREKKHKNQNPLKQYSKDVELLKAVEVPILWKTGTIQKKLWVSTDHCGWQEIDVS